jgi:cytochrome P450
MQTTVTPSGRRRVDPIVRVTWTSLVLARLGVRRGRSPLDIVVDASRGGPVSRWQVGSRVVHQVNDPALVHEVLATRATTYVRAAHLTRSLAPIFGDGVLIADGDAHRHERRRLASALGPRDVEADAPRVAAAIDRWADALPTNDVVDLEALVARLTLRLAVATFVGDVDESEIDRLGALLDALQPHARRAVRSSRPSPSWLPSRRRRERDRLLAEVDALLDAWRRSAGAARMLRALEAGRTESVADRRAVRDGLFSLLTAAQEGTTAAIVFAAHALARRPEMQRRVVDESPAATDARDDDAFVDRVFKETLRLYPPGWITLRAPTGAVVLGGQSIAKDAMVAVAPWALHRDRRWFSEPEGFEPDRWTPSFEASLPRTVYLPFGVGPHHCVGAAMGMMEARAVVTSLLRRVRLEAVSAAPLALSPGITLRPRRGVVLRLRAR